MIRKGAALVLVLLTVGGFAARAAGGQAELTVTMAWNGQTVAGGSLTLYPVEEGLDPAGALEYVEKHLVPGKTGPVGQDGSLRFGELSPGTYLVVQDQAAEGFQFMEPFVVELEEGQRQSARPKLAPEAPEMGDPGRTHLWLTLMGLSLIGMAVIVLYERKKHRKSD